MELSLRSADVEDQALDVDNPGISVGVVRESLMEADDDVIDHVEELDALSSDSVIEDECDPTNALSEADCEDIDVGAELVANHVDDDVRLVVPSVHGSEELDSDEEFGLVLPSVHSVDELDSDDADVVPAVISAQEDEDDIVSAVDSQLSTVAVEEVQS